MQRIKKHNTKYSPEFKISVILDMRNNHLGYRETVRKYWNTTTETETARYTWQVRAWERKYLEEGELGLMKDNRGRPTAGGKKRGRPPKLNKQVEEDLIAENQRLKKELEYVQMENEYIKKLSALVLADEQKNGKRRS